MEPKVHYNHFPYSEFYQEGPWCQENSPSSQLGKLEGTCLGHKLESMTKSCHCPPLKVQDKLSSVPLSFHADVIPSADRAYVSLPKVNPELVSPSVLWMEDPCLSTSQSIWCSVEGVLLWVNTNLCIKCKMSPLRDNWMMLLRTRSGSAGLCQHLSRAGLRWLMWVLSQGQAARRQCTRHGGKPSTLPGSNDTPLIAIVSLL